MSLTFRGRLFQMVGAATLKALGRAERIMVRRMSGVSLQDRNKHRDKLLSHLGIECVENKIQRARLR